MGLFKSATGTSRFKASPIAVDQSSFRKKLEGVGNQEELRKRQLGQTTRLEDQATGKAPSIADAELKSATNRSLAQQLAATKANRGGNAASRERQFAKAQSTAGRNIAEQATTAKLQERQLAETALAQQLQSSRSQDIGLAQADRASEQALQNLLVKQNLASQGLNLSGHQSASQQRSGLMENIMGGFGAMQAMSDKTNKKKIKSENNKDSKSFSEAISSRDNKKDAVAYSDEECKKDIEKEETDNVEQVSAPKVKIEKPENDSDIKPVSGDLGQESGSNWSAPSTPAAPAAPPTASAGGGGGGGGMLKRFTAMSDKDNKKCMDNENNTKKAKSILKKINSKDDKDKKDKKPIKASAFAKGFSKDKTPYRDTSYGLNMANRFMSEISDKNLKQEVKTDEQDFNPKSFLDALQAYSYEYKDEFKSEPKAGAGRHLSVMAQDLEKAGPVGRSMVKEDENGKYVDYGKGFGAILAAQAHLNQRLSDLENKKKS